MDIAFLVICLLLGGLLRFFDFGRKAIRIAPWLSPIFLLHFAHALEPSVGLPLIWLAIFVAAIFALRDVIPVPGAAYPLIVAGLTLVGTLPYLADRLLHTHLPGFGAALVFPVAWVVVEFVTTRTSPFGSWGSTAYTQAGDHALMQVASATGIWGISFLVAWFGSTVNWAWEQQFNWPIVHTGLIVYALAWGIVMLAGGTRLAFSKSGRMVQVVAIGWPEHLVERSVFMRAVAPEPMTEQERADLQKAFRDVQDYFLDASRREAAAGAKIIAWPEANVMVFQADEAAFMRRAEEVSAGEKAYLLMGLATIIESTPPRLENKAVLVDPSKGTVYSYIKKNPVPGWEAQISVRSDGRMPAYDSACGRLGSAVCFDMDFPHFIRQAGRLGLGLLLVPASDWEAIRDLHQIMASFRAVENGTSLLRATRWGISAAVDAYGRTSAATDSFFADQDVTTAQVEIKSIPTLYAKLGDWFAWLCVMGLAAVAAARVLHVI